VSSWRRRKRMGRERRVAMVSSLCSSARCKAGAPL
jgi:hypothetical protein